MGSWDPERGLCPLSPSTQSPSDGGASTSPLCLPLGVPKPGGLALVTGASTVPPQPQAFGDEPRGTAGERAAEQAWLPLGLPAPLCSWGKRQQSGVLLQRLNIGLGLATKDVNNAYIKIC